MAPPLGARRRVDPRRRRVGGGQTAEAPVECRADGSLVLTRAQYRQVGTGLPATPLPSLRQERRFRCDAPSSNDGLCSRAAHATRCNSPSRSRPLRGVERYVGFAASADGRPHRAPPRLTPVSEGSTAKSGNPSPRPAVCVAERATLPPAHGHGNFPPAVARFPGSGATCGDAGFGRGAGPTMRHRLRRAKPRSARFGRRAALDNKRRRARYGSPGACDTVILRRP